VLAQNVYDHYFYNYAGGNPQIIITPSFYTNETNCSVELETFINSTDETGLGYSIITEFYSPIGKLIGYGERELNLNVTCLSHGSVSTNEHNNSILESKIKTTRSQGTSHISILTAKHSCYTNSDWLYIISESDIGDSLGNVPNIYTDSLGCVVPPITYSPFINSDNYVYCSGISGKLTPQSYINPCLPNPHQLRIFWSVPFTTGESGIIIYNYTLPSGMSLGDNEYGYYELSDTGSYISLSILSDKLFLKENTDYVFYAHAVPLITTSTVEPPNITIGINVYYPDWVCGEWSECEYGQQQQTCYDPLGKIPNKIEYRGCIETAYFELLLGFEEGQDPTTPYIRKCELQWYPFCTEGYTDIAGTIEYPANWNVINPSYNHFLRLSSEYATEGSRSLQMWYIPPMWAYQYPPAICNWSNYGKVPQIYKGVNESLFVSYNITFPSPYMTIDYDVKRCEFPVVQYEGWCGKQCYGYNGNCSESAVKGEYVNVLFNPNTSEIIYEFYDEAALSWGQKHIDLTGSNITVGETYNLVFAVYPEHLTDAYGHCIYLDNVKISLRTAELECEDSYCIGVDLYKTKQLNQTCVYEIEYNSLECLEEADRILAQEFQDYCVDEDLYSYNNDTNEWEETLNATYCIEQEQESSIYDPLGIVEPIRAIVEPMGLGFVLFFAAPVFIALIIAIVGAFYVVDKLSFDKQGTGLVFLITFLSILGVESIIGLFPIWFVIMLIVISGIGTAVILNRT